MPPTTLKPAVEQDCGIDVIRVDREEHVENINDKIIVDLTRSQFVVADFTHHPNGVYFEAGYALGREPCGDRCPRRRGSK
jgi:hypothetical protein